jgi:hypothetical protein
MKLAGKGSRIAGSAAVYDLRLEQLLLLAEPNGDT